VRKLSSGPFLSMDHRPAEPSALRSFTHELLPPPTLREHRHRGSSPSPRSRGSARDPHDARRPASVVRGAVLVGPKASVLCVPKTSSVLI
jgi:hypothetical protein